jgi:hypothetical protein
VTFVVLTALSYLALDQSQFAGYSYVTSVAVSAATGAERPPAVSVDCQLWESNGRFSLW